MLSVHARLPVRFSTQCIRLLVIAKFPVYFDRYTPLVKAMRDKDLLAVKLLLAKELEVGEDPDLKVEPTVARSRSLRGCWPVDGLCTTTMSRRQRDEGVGGGMPVAPSGVVSGMGQTGASRPWACHHDEVRYGRGAREPWVRSLRMLTWRV
jgi:hypothetical protein